MQSTAQSGESGLSIPALGGCSFYTTLQCNPYLRPNSSECVEGDICNDFEPHVQSVCVPFCLKVGTVYLKLKNHL